MAVIGGMAGQQVSGRTIVRANLLVTCALPRSGGPRPAIKATAAAAPSSAFDPVKRYLSNNTFISLTNSDLTATGINGTSGQYGNIGAVNAAVRSSGKKVVGFNFNSCAGADINTGTAFGFATASFSFTTIVQFPNNANTIAWLIGPTATNDAYLRIGTAYYDHTTINGGGWSCPTGAGHHYQMLVDLDAKLLYLAVDGTPQYGMDPAAGTGGLDISAVTGALIPALSHGDANVGTLEPTPSYVPSGWSAWDAATGVAWNSFDASADLSFSTDFLTVTKSANNGFNSGVRSTATAYASNDLVYFEAEPVVLGTNHMGVGLTDGSLGVGLTPGQDGPGICYLSGGLIYYWVSGASAGVAWPPHWAGGDRIGLAYKKSTRTAWLLVNGVDVGGGNPATGVGGFVIDELPANYAFAELRETSQSIKGRFNASSLAYLPSGFSAFDPSISSGATLSATNLTTSSPALGSPTLAQVHALSANNLAPASPALGSPALAQVHALAANGTTTASPALASPVLGLTHILTATALATGSPSLGTPSIGQVHVLTAAALATGAPVLGTPALGQVHALTASAVTTASPGLGTPALGQVHALAAAGVATSSPVLGTPAVVEVVPLFASSLATSAPALGSPTIGQVHALTANALATGSPNMGAAALGQGHSLTASPLATSTPALGVPVLHVTHFLTADPLATTSPQIGSPAVAQRHALSAVSVATGAPVLGTPAVGTTGTDGLSASGTVTASPALGSPTLQQRHVLTANAATMASPALGSPVLKEAYALFSGTLTTGSPIIQLPQLGQRHALQANGTSTSSPQLDAPTLAGVHALQAFSLATGSPVLGTPAMHSFEPGPAAASRTVYGDKADRVAAGPARPDRLVIGSRPVRVLVGSHPSRLVASDGHRKETP